MGQALPKPAMRPFLPADTPMLAAIFSAAIEQLTGDDYSAAQQEAWAGAADDEAEFGKRLAGELTLIATLQNTPIGFAALTVDASDNAEVFFKKRGYVARQRNTVTINGEWLANTTMQKMLGTGGAQT